MGDIELYFPKVRKGGVFGGHDLHHKGVSRAFIEFINDKNDEIEEYFVGDSIHPDL